MPAHLCRVVSLLAVLMVAACSTRMDVPPASDSAPQLSPPAETPAGALTTVPPRSLIAAGISPPFTVEAPGDWEEWRGGGGRWFMLRQPASASSSIEITFGAVGVETGNPSGCQGLIRTGTAASVESLMAAMKADPRLVSSGAGAVKAGSASGQYLDVALSPSWTGTCTDSHGTPALDVPSIVYLEGSSRVRVILLDVAGTIVRVNIRDEGAASLDHAIATAMPIVESLRASG